MTGQNEDPHIVPDREWRVKQHYQTRGDVTSERNKPKSGESAGVGIKWVAASVVAAASLWALSKLAEEPMKEVKQDLKEDVQSAKDHFKSDIKQWKDSFKGKDDTSQADKIEAKRQEAAKKTSPER